MKAAELRTFVDALDDARWSVEKGVYGIHREQATKIVDAFFGGTLSIEWPIGVQNAASNYIAVKTATSSVVLRGITDEFRRTLEEALREAGVSLATALVRAYYGLAEPPATEKDLTDGLPEEPAAAECKRCSECTGEDHHWMVIIAEHDEETGEIVIPCKHCSATSFGVTCEACDEIVPKAVAHLCTEDDTWLCSTCAAEDAPAKPPVDAEVPL